MGKHWSRSSILQVILIGLLLVGFVGCQPLPPEPADPTRVAASVQARVETMVGARPTSTWPPSPTPTLTPEPTATSVPPVLVLPAPLYFLSDASGIDQIWRIEMNGGFAHRVTNAPTGVAAYDISPVDGSLAYVTGNDLYVSDASGGNQQMKVDGAEITAGQGYRAADAIYSPVWSPDGTELAYAENGVNVINLQTGSIRRLVTNHLSIDNPIEHRAYFPAYWSPDGRFLAVQVGYYEGQGLMILPAAGGELMDPQLWVCCELAPSLDPGRFYIASASMGYGEPGLWQVEWESAASTRLSREFTGSGVIPAYTHPLVTPDGRLYFFYGSDVSPTLAWAETGSPTTMTVLDDFPYLPVDALWAPDGGMLVAAGRLPEHPLQIWTPAGGIRPLEVSGWDLKWGLKTESDVAFAGTPAPTFTPTPTLPAVPAVAQPITLDNVTRLTLLTIIEPDEEIYSLAISPNNRLLALGLASSVHIWDLATMQRVAVLSPYRQIVPALDFSSDGHYLVVGSWDQSVDVWDMTTFEKVRSLVGHKDWVSDVSFSPDGVQIASVGSDNQLIVWNAATGSMNRITDLSTWGASVDFSPDGRFLAYALWNKDGLITDAVTGLEVSRLTQPEEQWVLDLKYSPDGRTLVLGTWDYRVVLWDVASSQARATLYGHNENPTGMAFTPDGRVLATADEGGDLRLWDAANGQQLHLMTGNRNVDISSDGRLLVTTTLRLKGAAVWYIP